MSHKPIPPGFAFIPQELVAIALLNLRNGNTANAIEILNAVHKSLGDLGDLLVKQSQPHH